MTFSLYANGMIGGDALTREIRSINNETRKLRNAVLHGADADSDDEEAFDSHAPLLAKVRPVGS